MSRFRMGRFDRLSSAPITTRCLFTPLCQQVAPLRITCHSHAGPRYLDRGRNDAGGSDVSSSGREIRSYASRKWQHLCRRPTPDRIASPPCYTPPSAGSGPPNRGPRLFCLGEVGPLLWSRCGLGLGILMHGASSSLAAKVRGEETTDTSLIARFGCLV